MEKNAELLIGGSENGQIIMNAAMANRHGLIAGATGTGKTVTLQILAEGFSKLGVPVFMADVKGDLSGLSKAGKPHPKIDERVSSIKIDDYQARQYPIVFWDLFGDLGHPFRTTISELGPLLLSTLLELNDTQTGILYSAFRIADDNKLLLLDLKDLRSMLIWMGDNAKELKSEYGNISSASIGAIQRRLLVLEEQQAEYFFGEPAASIEDLMKTDFSGNGVISIMDVTKLVSNSPRLYATFLLWLLSELFEELPEVGDADRPKLVFFFDEAHLLFDQAPKPLLDKVEQVVRLIRSKGVGVYFISQSPLDIPEDVLGQLGLRVQHALRAFTPKDRKAIKAVAENFRPNPNLDTQQVITELGIGEALVSTLDAKGSPTIVERTLIRPPESQMGPLTADERAQTIKRSPFNGKYDDAVDRESAYELLKLRALKAEQEQREAAEEEAKKKSSRTSSRTSSRDSWSDAMLKSAARSVGTTLGREGGKFLRGILGSLLRK
ncbi:MAG: helicase HerA-like domain-containing protein [Arenicellales bacterium]